MNLENRISEETICECLRINKPDESTKQTIRDFSLTKKEWESKHNSYRNLALMGYLQTKAITSPEKFKLNKKYEAHISQCNECQNLIKAYSDYNSMLHQTGLKINP